MAMVALLPLLFNADVLMLLLFVAAVWKLSSLTQGVAKLFSKLTASSGVNNIDKERCGKDDTAMVPLLLLLFDASVCCFCSGVSPKFYSSRD